MYGGFYMPDLRPAQPLAGISSDLFGKLVAVAGVVEAELHEDGSMAVVSASAFVWLGLVLGISFLEAPLKFRAPGVTLALGLGIGRLVFRALNVTEAGALAAVLVAVLLASVVPGPVVVGAAVAGGALLVQVAAVRPVLTRRSDAVLAGQDPPRSRAHLAYVALEVVKVVGLVVLGTGALAAI
jgi:hypothetical protein